MRAWRDSVLYPRKPADLSQTTFEKQELVARFFGGAPQLTDAGSPANDAVVLPKLAAPVIPPRGDANDAKPQPKKKKEGC